jgi:2,4-dienoyl-CoA reductase-like NADH-dependent reductase (Old Yellow Enzyme family)
MVKKAANIPVICVGDVRRPEEAETIVSEGLADLVAVGRGILADPSWASKVFEGRTDSIYFCHNCKRCHHFTDATRCPARLEAAKDSEKA